MLSSTVLITSAAIVILSASSGGRIAHGFAPPSSSSLRSSVILLSSSRRRNPSPSGEHDDDRRGGRRDAPSSSFPPVSADDVVVGRDRFLVEARRTTGGLAAALAILLTSSTSCPLPSSALVKGNAPPPPRGGEQQATTTTTTTTKCRNVEECQEIAEREETLRSMRDAERAMSGPKPRYAPGGTKYLDVLVEADDVLVAAKKASGGKEAAAAMTAKSGDVATVHYKVLKIGKRSYDGLSGEGTVVFSRGYGLEDDERVAGDRDFAFKIGDDRVIRALNDAVPGMAVGGTRRIGVTPFNGWEKNTRLCDGGPGGSGAGGELKTDYVVVPTATMVEQESCFDKTKLPFPSTYAQERRMAQRFDQSLIVEVRLVSLS